MIVKPPFWMKSDPSNWKGQNAESPTKIIESTIAETTSEVKIEELNEQIATASAGYSFLEDGISTNNRWLYEPGALTKEDEDAYPLAEAQAKSAKLLVDHTFLAVNDAAIDRFVEAASISDGKKTIPATTTIPETPSKVATSNKVYVF